MGPLTNGCETELGNREGYDGSSGEGLSRPISGLASDCRLGGTSQYARIAVLS
jgi:hypothetical protein